MVYENMFDKEVWIESSTYYHNEIAELGISIYKDYANGRYQMSSPNGNASTGFSYYNLGAFSSRSRKDVIFELNDIDSYIDRKIAAWKKKDKNKDSKLLQDVNDIYNIGDRETVYGMYFNTRYVISLKPCSISKGSHRYPYSINGNSFTRDGVDNLVNGDGINNKIYDFSDEGIAELKADLKRYLSRWYPCQYITKVEKERLSYNINMACPACEGIEEHTLLGFAKEKTEDGFVKYMEVWKCNNCGERHKYRYKF